MENGSALSEASIRVMVDRFYAAVRKDEVLGPVFEHALHGQWEEHMPRMYAFWSTVLLGSGSFQGNVYGKHMALSGITKEHFVRWLALFKETVERLLVEGLFAPDAAREALLVADRIAGSLQYGFFGKRLA
ncbi:group III truncated hemoglobin [Noviherbaspirillum sp. UKPF54]|uniref:group III truncated hemoglobin n=1 Tax=Noviherbaspirillum sp. UKPF54 TaxID=2601898 RepID=UPI0011B18436|nr:group III truncated hemoglobin [Noviherbaspirillum sp. UKPF54]QDZ26742.1 group III truncated hemoglobin [Noviherbaspirillum sp. UKPF54]